MAKKLVSILVAWKSDRGAEPYLMYDVCDLGEGVARTRAAQRVSLCKASGLEVTDYLFDWDDGTSITVKV
jgi:hypothetical protein